MRLASGAKSPLIAEGSDGGTVLVLALFADDNPCAPAKFQRIGAVYDLSAVRHLDRSRASALQVQYLIVS